MFKTNGEMMQVRSTPTINFIACVVLLGAACTKGQQSPDSVREARKASTESEILATVGSQKITMADVRSKFGTDLDKAEMQYEQFRSAVIDGALDQLVRERLISEAAKKEGKTSEELVDAEAGAGGLEPNDEDIARWYADNQARTGGRQLAEIRGQIAELLRKQMRAEAEAKLDARLRSHQAVVINFQPYRLEFDNTNAASSGRENAPVTLVEFSDFQCPFCRQFASTLKSVTQSYGDKVRVVYRQYPIPSLHPNALKAAEAALCANDQGKFWAMHDAMFADQTKLGVEQLKVTAGSLGVDRREFDSCLDTGRHAGQVAADIREGGRAGVSGTPAIFINGVEVRGGAVPKETVQRAIDQELSRARVK